MKISLPYGRTQLTADLPDLLDIMFLDPREAAPIADPDRAVREALDGVDWMQFAGARTVAIAINDKTRPVPHGLLLPPLLASLESLGIEPQNITLLIATGCHPPMRPEEFPDILPAEVIRRYRVLSHDIEAKENFIALGMTPRGTPVTINRIYAEADLRLVVGNVEPHQFVGFSGGVKSAVIGLAGWETITANHRMMTHPDAQIGTYEQNPVRQDVEDLGQIVGVHLALNSVMNRRKQIVRVFCGPPRELMRQAIPLVRQVYGVPISEPFDLVITAPGGYPKDINVYQAQKALAHASLVTRASGPIVIVAACPEGTGSSRYENWVRQVNSHQAVIERFTQEGYRVGPHKAYQIARDTVGRRVVWVTALPDPASLLLESAPTLQDAINRVLDPGIRRVGVLPYANATIPSLVSQTVHSIGVTK
jgi:nickel-dependent lactate racemase